MFFKALKRLYAPSIGRIFRSFASNFGISITRTPFLVLQLAFEISTLVGKAISR